jgi:hypothetical protein
MKPIKYVIVCCVSALGFGALVAGFNWFVDPFAYFGRNPFGAYHNYETRLLKARMTDGKKYDAVIFGSSRADTIDTKFTEKWGMKSFNASFLGAYPEEILYLVRNFLTDAKTAIIGFDYYMFNSECRDIFKPTFGATSLKELEKYGISYYAVRHSALTVKKYLQKRPTLYKPSGSRNMYRQEAENRAATTTDYTRILNFFETGFACDYKLSDERIKIAQTIVSTLRQSGHTIHLFMHPFHPALHERISNHGQAPVFEEWRGRMKAAFPGIHDLTMEPFSKPKDFYWNDPVHYTKATGGEIIDLIFGSVKH